MGGGGSHGVRRVRVESELLSQWRIDMVVLDAFGRDRDRSRMARFERRFAMERTGVVHRPGVESMEEGDK